MKKRLLLVALASSAIVLFSTCKKDKACDVAGATFTSDSGQMSSLFNNKCSGSSCHSAGGDGASHWEYSTNYSNMHHHFSHMYEAVMVEGEMPPDTMPQLTSSEKEMFECFKTNGFPE